MEGKSFVQIDSIKRQIIHLYDDDFRKLDGSGRMDAIYKSIPAQLARGTRKYRITFTIGKRNNTKTEEFLYDLIDSKSVLPCFNTTDSASV